MARVLVPLLTTAGLVGGFGVARATGRRWAGGVVLGALGTAAWFASDRSSGPVKATALTVAYLGAFGGSHPLARRLGAWPSVLTVAGVTAAAGAVLAG